MLRFHSNILWLAIFMLLNSCNGQTKNEEFIARYQIGKADPFDTTSGTLSKIKQTTNWTISLEEKNNFELTGTGKNIVGYWDVEKMSENEYKLLLQGGGWTIYGRFDGTTMYFDFPYKNV